MGTPWDLLLTQLLRMLQWQASALGQENRGWPLRKGCPCTTRATCFLLPPGQGRTHPRRAPAWEKKHMLPGLALMRGPRRWNLFPFPLSIVLYPYQLWDTTHGHDLLQPSTNPQQPESSRHCPAPREKQRQLPPALPWKPEPALAAGALVAQGQSIHRSYPGFSQPRADASRHSILSSWVRSRSQGVLTESPHAQPPPSAVSHHPASTLTGLQLAEPAGTAVTSCAIQARRLPWTPARLGWSRPWRGADCWDLKFSPHSRIHGSPR